MIRYIKFTQFLNLMNSRLNASSYYNRHSLFPRAPRRNFIASSQVFGIYDTLINDHDKWNFNIFWEAFKNKKEVDQKEAIKLIAKFMNVTDTSLIEYFFKEQKLPATFKNEDEVINLGIALMAWKDEMILILHDIESVWKDGTITFKLLDEYGKERLKTKKPWAVYHKIDIYQKVREAIAAKQYEKFDKNKDGKLSKEELEAWLYSDDLFKFAVKEN